MTGRSSRILHRTMFDEGFIKRRQLVLFYRTPYEIVSASS